eukprot:7097493-Prymnesium_polylepis.1
MSAPAAREPPTAAPAASEPPTAAPADASRDSEDARTSAEAPRRSSGMSEPQSCPGDVPGRPRRSARFKEAAGSGDKKDRSSGDKKDRRCSSDGGARTSTRAPRVFSRAASIHSTTGDAAVLQAQGHLGNATCVDPDTKVPVRILLYRLVSLNPNNPWGEGLLLDIARSTDDDTVLEQRLMVFLEKSYLDDP